MTGGNGHRCLVAASLMAPMAVAAQQVSRPDTVAIVALARDISSDAMRGRGPWTKENETVARRLAADLEHLGAHPIVGSSLLVPFTAAPRPRDTVYNVVGLLPGRGGTTAGQLVGLTAHFDHLGVGRPDASGDSIYNGFLDDALSIGMIVDLARRYVAAPGDRPLLIMFFNLEEQGLLGSETFVRSSEGLALADRLGLLVGADAGSPAGEAMEWQLMGANTGHTGARLADSLARMHGWTTTSSATRSISDVFAFSQLGVPILFPIPGARWRGYTDAQRAGAMRAFDHYHQPADQWRPDFPLTGTAFFADWLWTIIRAASNSVEALR